MKRFTFFATCAPGVEPILHAESKALGLARLERQVGGVRFEGTMVDARRANLWLRTAVRILRREARFEAASESALDAAVAGIDWSRFLHPDGTLWVDAQSKESGLDHTQFLKQRVKDGIVDQLRLDDGTRPSVDRETAELRVHLHLFRDRATLSVDTSGASLHRRGWRSHQGRAPLSETLAAAVVLMGEWNRRAPIIDPFCGTGTLLVEAAMVAWGVPPGATRTRFGFESWQDHNADAWRRERERAIATIQPNRKLRLVGFDLDAERVRETRAHLADHPYLGALAENAEIAVRDARAFEGRSGWNAFVVANLPYGQRVGEEVEALHGEFGSRLAAHSGYSCSLLTGSSRLAGLLRLPGHGRTRMLNGGIECEVVTAVLP